MTQYVGMDVHKATTSIVTQNDEGDIISESVVATQPQPLIGAVSGFQGPVEVAFEEASWSAWLYSLLQRHVDRVAVHAAEDHDHKTDHLDAARLAKLLRHGDINEVYHGPQVDTQLKVLVKGYHRVADDLAAEKNRLKSEFTRQQIDCQGTAVFQAANQEEWLGKLEGKGTRMRARQTYERIRQLEGQKDEIKTTMKKAAQQRDGWAFVSTLPGFGVVRTSTVIGIVGVPFRFPTKQHLWSYSGLGIDLDESSQYKRDGQGGFTKKETTRTRGLNEDGHPRLKESFKGAAKTAINHNDRVRQDYRARCQRKDDELAELDIARKLAAQCWTIWKRKEEYDPDKACWDTL